MTDDHWYPGTPRWKKLLWLYGPFFLTRRLAILRDEHGRRARLGPPRWQARLSPANVVALFFPKSGESEDE